MRLSLTIVYLIFRDLKLDASRSADLDMLVHYARHSLPSGTLLSFVPDVDGMLCSPETLFLLTYK